MAKSDLGTKRIDPETGRKFYDLNKDPIVSPYTGKSYPRSFFDAGSEKVLEEEVEDEKETEEEDAPETISLEDADDEAKGDDIPDLDDDEDVDLGDDDDDTFLEDEEEEEDDVSGMIGVGEDEDEA
ncbi:MAG: TIGR02300 family protein [Mesorhizobium sp.]|nr:TIGR02300 family protein [Mesorhizobium sp.]MBL8578143.1 TIGR02300 family protein [Mesorhizobium sp.]